MVDCRKERETDETLIFPMHLEHQIVICLKYLFYIKFQIYIEEIESPLILRGGLLLYEYISSKFAENVSRMIWSQHVS